MSFMFASPQLMAAAAADVAGIGSTVSAAAHTASANTTQLLSAAGDEVSTSIAALFSAHGQQFQAINAQAATFHDQFLRTLSASANSYAVAEAANTVQQELLAAINAPTQMLLGRNLIGDGANATTPGGKGGDGGLLWGNGGMAPLAAAGQTGGAGGSA
ncbi:PE family protein, partial [Mycobacterium szulgai]|uniref:PE family protein n=1 Tax=Mycobacterium szulgai TaxID=1787 RepID=UPI0021F29630